MIYSGNIEDHFTHVEEMLLCLYEAGIRLKLKKREVFTDKVHQFGHTIRPGRVENDAAVTTAFRGANNPRDHADLRSLLGLRNVYLRFVRCFFM